MYLFRSLIWAFPILPSGLVNTTVLGTGQTLAYGLQGQALLNPTPFITFAVTGQSIGNLGPEARLLGAAANLDRPGASASGVQTGLLNAAVPTMC